MLKISIQHNTIQYNTIQYTCSLKHNWMLPELSMNVASTRYAPKKFTGLLGIYPNMNSWMKRWWSDVCIVAYTGPNYTSAFALRPTIPPGPDRLTGPPDPRSPPRLWGPPGPWGPLGPWGPPGPRSPPGLFILQGLANNSTRFSV